MQTELLSPNLSETEQLECDKQNMKIQIITMIINNIKIKPLHDVRLKQAVEQQAVMKTLLDKNVR